MSYENIENLDIQILSIVRGIESATSNEYLKNAPTLNKAVQSAESFIKNFFKPMQAIKYFVNFCLSKFERKKTQFQKKKTESSLKSFAFQIYSHPILLATILSQCKVDNYSKMGLLESLKVIKEKKGLSGIYTALFPRMLSIFLSHLADTTIQLSFRKILGFLIETAKTLMFEYANKMVDRENNFQMQENEDKKTQRINKEKITKFLKWILILCLIPIVKYLVKYPLEVISSNLIVHSFQNESTQKTNFLSEFFYIISKIYKEKGIRGFYAASFTSVWASFYSSIFRMIPLPIIGSFQNLSNILNLFVQQSLHYSFYTTRLRMITSTTQSVLSTKGSHASYSHLWREEGFSSFFSGLNKYLFLLPIVAIKYYFSSREKTQNTDLFGTLLNNQNNEQEIEEKK